MKYNSSTEELSRELQIYLMILALIFRSCQVLGWLFVVLMFASAVAGIQFIYYD